MLFVNDYQAEVWLRSKDNASRADNYIEITAAYCLPLVILLTQGQLAVEDGYAVRKSGGKAFYCLGCHGNLRDEDDPSFAQFHRFGQGLEVDLRLAATGDTVEQESQGVEIGRSGNWETGRLGNWRIGRLRDWTVGWLGF